MMSHFNTGDPMDGRGICPLLPLIATLLFLAAQVTGQADDNTNPRHSDPDSAQLVTRDIENFWRAYDQAGPNNACSAFQEEYFNKGSIGLRDFVQLRIDSACTLANWVARHPQYYGSIRSSTQRVASFTPEIRQSFRKLKELYPDAIFPNVYFVIGRMNSGGTTSYNGLLIGVEMYGRTPTMPTSELTDWQKQVLKPVDELPGIVAHELIHFQQKGPEPKTLLGKAIREGSADFIGSIISGKNINSLQKDYGDKHERELWSEFKQAMHGTDTSEWLSNGSDVKGRPADLGYYMGFRISEAYYTKSKDKKQAIRDILEIQDFDALLKASGYADNFLRAVGTGAK
jgi:hypothetical protein